jgi:fructuronate reductase
MRAGCIPTRWPRCLPTSRGPRYDRAALQAGIVHLGVGAFHRAHIAVVNEAALHASGDLRWGTVGVSLRAADTRDALRRKPASTRSRCATRRRRQPARGAAGGRQPARRTGGARRPASGAGAHRPPATRIVSLTVTEKGYHHDPATGALRLPRPTSLHDLAHPEAPRTMPGFVVHALALRRARGLAPVTVLSCDNLPANGDTTRGIVLAISRSAWIPSWHAGSPSTAAFPIRWSTASCRAPPTPTANR